MKTRYIALLTICGLVAVRQLNTEPSRTWVGNTRYGGHAEVQTVNDLFGSSYRGFVLGEDIGISSKNFSDVLSSVQSTNLPPKKQAARDAAAAAEQATIDKDRNERIEWVVTHIQPGISLSKFLYSQCPMGPTANGRYEDEDTRQMLAILWEKGINVSWN